MPIATLEPSRRPGLRENGAQFALLVLVVTFVGAMVGVERSVLPLLAKAEFGLTSATVTLSFLVTFGLAKAPCNFLAGALMSRGGRRRVLLAGWLVGLPVPFLIMWAPSWGWITFANLLLGVNQGLTWSATQIMKIDLAGSRERGLALGANELTGYLGVAFAALGAAHLAHAYGARPAPYFIAAGAAALGLAVTFFAVSGTEHVARAQDPGAWPAGAGLPVGALAGFLHATTQDRRLAGTHQAGFVNNLKDGLAWALLPLYFAAHGLGLKQIGLLAAVYPAVWGVTQVATGALSDRWGRRPLIAGGLLVQAIALVGFATLRGFEGWLACAVLLGVGTAAVYPTLIAQASDLVPPGDRPIAIGTYRLWRDLGYVAGALVAGAVTDLFSFEAAISLVAVLVAISAVVARVLLPAPAERT